MPPLELIAALLGLLTAWSASLIWAMRWVLASQRKYMDEKVAHLTALIDSHAKAMAEVERELSGAGVKLERELMSLKAELPEKYVRREDWIRFANVVDAKLDALNERQSNTNMRIGSLAEKVEHFMCRSAG